MTIYRTGGTSGIGLTVASEPGGEFIGTAWVRADWRPCRPHL